MPRLPSIDNTQRATPTPAGGIARYDGTAEARGLGQIGQALTNVSDRLGQEEDAQAVFKARRDLDKWENDTIYDPKTGAINKLGQDAFGLPEQITTSFNQAVDNIQKGLRGSRQNQLFQEMVASRRNQVNDWTNRHVLQQRNVFDEGQYQADISATRDRAAKFANDPARVAAEMAIGSERTIGYLRGKGKSTEEISQVLREQAEKTHVEVLNTLLAGDNWKAAKSYLDKNAEAMNPAAVLRLSNQVQKQEDAVEGAAAAHAVIGSIQPNMQPTDLDRVVNITMASESGGRRFGADGKLLTSSAGAKGEMQVMDGTNKDPGFGVKPAKDDSPDERARVGRDYLNAMIKRYGGDMSKAWAAYNAGPGAVDSALKTSQEQNDPQWTIFLPQETQAYVAKNMAALESGGGSPQRPTLKEVHDTVRATLAGQRPERVKVALDESTRLFKEQTDEIKQREDEALATAQRGLAQNGGSWNALPPEVRNAVPAGKVDDLLNYGARIAKGEDQTDPIVFQKMATDDKWLKGMSDAEFYFQSRKLSQSDQKQMALRRGQLLSGKGGNGPGDVDFASLNSTLNSRLNQMGIDPTPPDRDKSGQQRVGAIRNAIQNYVLQQQQQAGKKFNDAEMAKTIDQAIARQVQFRTTGFFGGVTDSSERLLTMQPGDIPPAVREKLKADFKANGVPSPSDGDILGAYLQLKLR
jgi:soluble lytic murein transglycosylase-like protein